MTPQMQKYLRRQTLTHWMCLIVLAIGNGWSMASSGSGPLMAAAVSALLAAVVHGLWTTACDHLQHGILRSVAGLLTVLVLAAEVVAASGLVADLRSDNLHVSEQSTRTERYLQVELERAQRTVASARQALDACPANHYTRCIDPANAELASAQDAEAAAVAALAAFVPVAAESTTTTVAEMLGITGQSLVNLLAIIVFIGVLYLYLTTGWTLGRARKPLIPAHYSREVLRESPGIPGNLPRGRELSAREIAESIVNGHATALTDRHPDPGVTHVMRSYGVGHSKARAVVQQIETLRGRSVGLRLVSAREDAR